MSTSAGSAGSSGASASSSAALPRPLQRVARASALDLACALLRSHPELLNPCFPAQGSESEEEDEPMWAAQEETSEERAGGKKRGLAEHQDDRADKQVDKASKSQRLLTAPAICGASEPAEESEALDDPVLAVLQRLCLMTPDRAEWRAAAAEAAVLLLSEATASEKVCKGELGMAARFLPFLWRLLHCERSSGRGLAVELATTVLASEQDADGMLAAASASTPTISAELLATRLVCALAERCADTVPTVRGRALVGLGAALGSVGERSETLLRRLLLGEATEAPLLDAARLLRAGANDEKALVRRAALGFCDCVLPLLRSLGLAAEAAFQHLQPQLLCELSADESVAVRRSAIGSLAVLLRSCPIRPVFELWSQSVLPMVVDNEASVAERALDEVELAVLKPLEQAADSPKGQIAGQLPAVLDALDSETAEYLQRALGCLAKRNQGKLPASLSSALAAVAAGCVLECRSSEWPLPLWLMLEEAASTDPKSVPAQLPLDAWRALGRCRTDSFLPLGASVLRVLEHTVDHAPAKSRSELAEELLHSLTSFSAPVDQVPAMLRVVARVRAGARRPIATAARGPSLTSSDWKADLLRPTVNLLESVQASGEADVPSLCSALFVLGELALLDETVVSEGVTSIVQTLALDALDCQGFRVRLSPAVRGHAFVALGKLCLRREALAKRLVEVLVLHLDSSQPFVVRNNILLVFGDLCAQYTSAAERFLSRAADLLQDPNELLRKQAVMVLASLVSEGFVRFKGDLLLRFVYVLSDPSDDVRRVMETVFARVLLPQQPALFSLHLVDAICSLNGWDALPGHQGLQLVMMPARRAGVYRFMLSQMSPEHKLSACLQIVSTLLGAFVAQEDGLGLDRLPARSAKSLQGPAGQALGDALRLLCCQEMRGSLSQLGARPTGNSGGSQADKEEAGGDVAAATRAQLKGAMCEEVCPVLIQLRHLMEEQRSPLLGLLRMTLLELLRDWRSEGEEQLCCSGCSC
ncbi:unnamed protein product [Polarella glacialis]|uniref:Condensin complex subunit 1 C-terminal domain-containing protein n=1 Tax=Polarella glacialis TaxID=89957 RepID=A0A813LUA8_POLGL|nr:unnamed protein product [Polarella glacialis]